MPAGRPASPRLLVAGLLAVAVLAVFWPVLGHDFINYDDDGYVTANAHVQGGLDLEGVRWAWTTLDAANWHPLTWMSHMLDWSLFGPGPAGHHATSLVLHLANTLLLFGLLETMTGSLWRSALVAALFGVHPLHVESVAWVSERKDVLSTAIWLLTTLAYVRYARAPGVGRLALVVLGLTLGLAAKPMLVTLPMTLLLWDYWPLGRLLEGDRSSSWRLVREKLPLLLPVVASAVVTFVAQREGGAMGTLDRYPLGVRFANALVSYATYLWKTLWPVGLVLPYPHPGSAPPVWQVAGSALALAALTALALRVRRRHPYLLVGWLWYVGTLVPVIGLVQVGEQAMADRFTYVPLIGIFLAAAWLLPPSRLAQVAVGVLLLALMVRASVQVGYWRDSITLFRHAIAVDPANPIAHLNLGIALDGQGHAQEAIAHFEDALRVRPRYAEAHNAIGNALLRLERTDEAIVQYATAVDIAPDSPQARNNFGHALARRGRVAEAIPQFEHALRIKPDFPIAEKNLGMALANAGRVDEALEHLARAVQYDPRDPEALNNLGGALLMRGRLDEGLAYITTAVRLKPDFGMAHANRATALFQQGRYAEAWEAVRLARATGTEPSAPLLRLLSEKMPAP